MIVRSIKYSFSFRFSCTEITFHTEWDDKTQHSHECDGVACAQTKKVSPNIFIDVSKWRPFDFIKRCRWIYVAVDIVISVFWLAKMVEFF